MTGRRYSALAIALMGAALVACAGEAGSDADTAAAIAGRDTGAAAAAPADGPMLDPNTATREQLVALPGMVPAAADTLVARRPFENMTAVNGVLTSQLDSAQRHTLYGRLWRPIDLNKASDEEILLIPGVGAKMLHEFKEYRPYTSMDQFRREIGKYVDDDELERLARYVEIRQ